MLIVLSHGATIVQAILGHSFSKPQQCRGLPKAQRTSRLSAARLGAVGREQHAEIQRRHFRVPKNLPGRQRNLVPTTGTLPTPQLYQFVDATVPTSRTYEAIRPT